VASSNVEPASGLLADSSASAAMELPAAGAEAASGIDVAGPGGTGALGPLAATAGLDGALEELAAAGTATWAAGLAGAGRGAAGADAGGTRSRAAMEERRPLLVRRTDPLGRMFAVEMDVCSGPMSWDPGRLVASLPSAVAVADGRRVAVVGASVPALAAEEQSAPTVVAGTRARVSAVPCASAPALAVEARLMLAAVMGACAIPAAMLGGVP